MQSSFPQIKVNFNPFMRPAGCINSYASLVNTSKTNKLMRHRIREIVLSIALVTGFFKHKSRAKELYPNDKHREKQCTFLHAQSILSPQHKRYFSDTLMELPSAMYKTLRCFYKYDGINLYDTKKFRTYQKRLEFGKPNKHGFRKIILKHTIQYMSSPLLACMFAIYGGNIQHSDDVYRIDISRLSLFKQAYDKASTAKEINKYLAVVLRIPNTICTKRGRLVFLTDQARDTFWNRVNNEAELLYSELDKGGYLGKNRTETNDAS